MIRLLHMSRDVPNNMPLLSILQSGKIIPLTQDMVRKKLSQLLPDKIYGTHSLRRGGATWLLVSGVSLDMVKSLVVLSPNLRRGLKQNFVAKSGILGFLILFGRFLYEEKY